MPVAHKAGDWFADVRAQGVARVAQAFGLEVGGPERARWVKPCPACGAGTRHPKRGDKRGAVGVSKEGLGWACFECEAKGDAVTLAAFSVTNAIPAKGDKRWADVRRACAERGWCDADPRDGRPAPAVRLVKPPPMPAPAPPKRPPAAEVSALWSSSLRLDAWGPGDGEWCGEARRYLSGRGFNCGDLAALDVARILPPPERYDFPAWWSSRWAKTWRVVVQAFEADGTLASLHGRRVDGGAEKKTTWPMGAEARGLLMAGPRGRAFLAGELPAPPPAVLVVEGLTDLLAYEAWAATDWHGVPVLAVTSGGASAFARVRWPAGVPLYVATDNDKTGDEYAEQVRAALPAGVTVKRMRLGQERKP